MAPSTCLSAWHGSATSPGFSWSRRNWTGRPSSIKPGAPASIVRLAAGRRPCRCRLTSASAEGYGGGTSGPRRLEPAARRRHTTGSGARVAPLLPPPDGASRSPATLCRRRIPHTFRSGVQSSATPTPAVLPLLPVPPHSPVLETCDPAADRRNLRLVGRWLEGAVTIELRTNCMKLSKVECLLCDNQGTCQSTHCPNDLLKNYHEEPLGHQI